MEHAILFILAAACAGLAFLWKRTCRHLGESAAETAGLRAENDGLKRQMEERQSDLDAIIGNMTEGLLVADGTRAVRLANRAVRELFGITDNPAGRTIIETLRDVAVDEIVRDALAAGDARTAEISILLPAKRPRYFSVSAVPSSARASVVVVFYEITKLRELEEMRREFVANVSHELRTPLSIFQGYIETLIDQPDMERAGLLEILQIMERHSKRLNAIVEDLLTLARLESRSDDLEMAGMDVGDFLRQIARDWQRPSDARGIPVRPDIAPGLPPVMADEQRMAQVFNNLIDNALKYSQPGGVITLSARRDRDFVELAVADTGSGIPAEHLPHIFERFYRVDKGRSRAAGGTGLGLSIVKHIVALHGGTVEARSRPGQGTTIVVRLPAVA
jgi:two-component system phosphate regulon sensor histidine kinase PhoR